MQNTKFIILAPLSSISKRLRLFKIVKYFNSLSTGSIIEHIGWERVAYESIEKGLDFDVEKRIILRGGGYGGKKMGLYYLIWMLKSFFTCLSINKNDCVWALGFESAFPAVLASKLKGFKVIFDDADRFSLIMDFPKLITSIIKYFEKFTSRNVFIHLIPGKERYDFISKKFFILKNMPSIVELNVAKEIFNSKEWPTGKLVVNINGWLNENRGLDVATDVVEKTKNFDIIYLIAGKISGEIAEQLILKKNVVYLGEVSNSFALASYFASDLVLTYFKPNSIINTLAESNKWGDAIKIGVGIIVNKEVKTAAYLKEGLAAISFEYEDRQSLIDKLINLSNNPDELERLKFNSKSLADKFGYFEDQLSIVFEKIRNS